MLEQVLPPSANAGVRIHGNRPLDSWLRDGSVADVIRSVLGENTQPVRAILFDKSPDANWALGWHQDRIIAVRKYAEVPGFDHWNSKQGAIHVEPPFEYLERMVTARLHLDAVDEANGPLLVSVGSHREGRVAEAAIENVVRRSTTAVCLAARGDVWLYRTAVLHASERSQKAASRRVLQVDFSADALPGGLEWLGIG